MSKIDQVRKRLRAKYLHRLAESSTALKAAKDGFRRGEEESLKVVSRLAHQLQGSGGSYGFDNVTDAAAALFVNDHDGAARLDELIELLENISSERSNNPTVLIIDDDDEFCDLIRDTLIGSGFNVRDVRSAAAIDPDVLSSVDIVTLDLRLGDQDGRDALERLREELDITAPLVVVSVLDDEHIKAECLALGATDYIAKPVNPVELAKRLWAVIDRISGTEIGSDPLTGLMNRRAFLAAYDSHTLESDDSPISLAMLDLDRFKDINDAYGHLVGDEVLQLTSKVLQMQLRGADLIARWGGEEFVIALPRTSISEAVVVLDRIQVLLHRQTLETPNGVLTGISFSAGVTPINGIPFEGALERADILMYSAKKAGRRQVHTASSAPPPPQILVIEDDDSTADLVKAILQSDGYRVKKRSDGHSAIDALERENFDLVLVDAGLPDLEGLEIVDWMRKQHTYRRTPVLMLTANSDETLLEDAFERGVDDFVVKPLSERAFLARIRRLNKHI